MRKGIAPRLNTDMRSAPHKGVAPLQEV